MKQSKQEKVRKIMSFHTVGNKELETKLEKWASEGLFVEKIGTTFWTLYRAEPKKLKFAVTYFPEASLFNPVATDNQQTYFQYAKESGWDFVIEQNQMQIFSNEDEYAVPFETDEKEKYENLKKYMRKIYMPFAIISIFMWGFCLVMQYRLYQVNPVEYLSHTTNILTAALLFIAFMGELCKPIHYMIWCKLSEKAIATGGGCVDTRPAFLKVMDIVFLILISCIVVALYLEIAKMYDFLYILLIAIHIPIIALFFRFSIGFLKKRKKSAKLNMILSFAGVMVVNFAYFALILFLVLEFGILRSDNKSYETIQWQMTPTQTREYEIYRDEIPLTCEDLYGQIPYAYYSTEHNRSSTLFLSRSEYTQRAMPQKNGPPHLEYEVVIPKFDFVYHIVLEQYKKLEEWSNEKRQVLDNSIFNTVEAYEFSYDGQSIGKYLLVYPTHIILLNLEDAATVEQIATINEKLEPFQN